MSNKVPQKKDRKMALVVVDVQRKFTGKSITEESCAKSVEIINKATARFHECGRPVIFVYFDGPCTCSSYSKDDGDEYLHGIISHEKDIVVHKEHMNSFVETRLAEVVKECGCDSILLTGMVTQLCVMGTYYGAFEHRLIPHLLQGGTIATADKLNDAACALCSTFTLEDMEENLRSTKVPEPTEMYGSEHQKCAACGQ